jgi:hypothetical protein
VLFLAWYGMCARAINIQDPLHPVEVGHLTYQIDPSRPEFAGCDTYDIILGQNGLLYVSDGTSGLRVVKYTGEVPQPVAGNKRADAAGSHSGALDGGTKPFNRR